MGLQTAAPKKDTHMGALGICCCYVKTLTGPVRCASLGTTCILQVGYMQSCIRVDPWAARGSC